MLDNMKFTKQLKFEIKNSFAGRTRRYFCPSATWQRFSFPLQLNIPEMNSQTLRSWKKSEGKKARYFPQRSMSALALFFLFSFSFFLFSFFFFFTWLLYWLL